jgi:hypothetical protein
MIRLIVHLTLAFVFLLPPSHQVPARQLKPAGEGAFTILRGRVTCLNASGKRAASDFECDAGPHRFSFEAVDAKSYSFYETDPLTAMFADPRVRGRELQITARLNGRDQLELIKVQSIRQGKLYDIYYFCEICNIKTMAPGPCPCCRNELEFRETPVAEP